MSRRKLALRCVLTLLCAGLSGGAMAPEASATRAHTASGARNHDNALAGSCVTAAGQRELACSSVPNAETAPKFTVEKLQEIDGDYTTSELEGHIGETVYYEIIATNTGESPIEIVGFADTQCEEIEQSDSSTILERGGSIAWYCQRQLVATARYSNQAHVEAQNYSSFNGARAPRARPAAAAATVSHASNIVYVTVPRPEFVLKKFQRIGREGSYTAAPLKANIGQVVEYLVVAENTGEEGLYFSSLDDAKCTAIAGGPGENEVPPENYTEWTCSHTLTANGTYTNEALVEATPSSERSFSKANATPFAATDPISERSNAVVVAVGPHFTIQKLQETTGTFTASEVKGHTGEVVHYEIVVSNTGAGTLAFEPLEDSGCEGVSPGGASELEEGQEETFTCTHTLTAPGTYHNSASITLRGGTGKETSNTVTAKVEKEPAFSIEKLQALGSAGSFTKEEVSGQDGETVHYEVVVKNTGNTALTFGALKDAGCEGITPSGASELKERQEETFTCSHTLTVVGSYSNEAAIEGDEGVGRKTSNKVTATARAFTIEKLQRIEGEPSFTKNELGAVVGARIDYEIVVKNIANVALTFGPLEDSGCEGVSPGGASELKKGQEEGFTCSHTVTAPGRYSNEASIKRNESTEVGTSNRVTVTVPSSPASKSRPPTGESTTPPPSATPGRIELAEPFTGSFTWSLFTVTATVSEGGAPQPGVPVSFSVTGANPQTGSLVTDADGQATFSYVPANAGLDRIVVSFQNRSKETISNELAKTWVALPPPTLGETINIGLVSGNVYIEEPPSAKAGAATSVFAPTFEPAYAATTKHSRFVPLIEARQVRVGSTLDTTAGVARVITASGRAAQLQSGEFGAGIFKILQPGKQHGLTELRIVDNVSKQACTHVAKRATVARRLSSKVLGRLNSSAHGKFTARGQFSAATVRGTIWSVANRCDGTLTRVTRDVVTVRDFVRHKTITLHSGQAYLAKAP